MRTVDDLGQGNKNVQIDEICRPRHLKTGRYLEAHLAGKSQRKFLAIIYLG